MRRSKINVKSFINVNFSVEVVQKWTEGTDCGVGIGECRLGNVAPHERGKIAGERNNEHRTSNIEVEEKRVNHCGPARFDWGVGNVDWGVRNADWGLRRKGGVIAAPRALRASG